MKNFLSSGCSNSIVSVAERLISSINLSIGRFIFLRCVWLEKVWFWFVRHNHDSQNIPENAISFDLFWYSSWTLSLVSGFFSRKVLTKRFLLFKVHSKWKLSICDWNIFDCVQCSGILTDQKCRSIPVIITYLDFQTYISSTLFVSFFIMASFRRLLPEDNLLLLKKKCFVSYIGFRIMIGRKGQKCFYHKHISVLQLLLLKNYTIELLC